MSIIVPLSSCVHYICAFIFRMPFEDGILFGLTISSILTVLPFWQRGIPYTINVTNVSNVLIIARFWVHYLFVVFCLAQLICAPLSFYASFGLIEYFQYSVLIPSELNFVFFSPPLYFMYLFLIF